MLGEDMYSWTQTEDNPEPAQSNSLARSNVKDNFKKNRGDLFQRRENKHPIGSPKTASERLNKKGKSSEEEKPT